LRIALASRLTRSLLFLGNGFVNAYNFISRRFEPLLAAAADLFATIIKRSVDGLLPRPTAQRPKGLLIACHPMNTARELVRETTISPIAGWRWRPRSRYGKRRIKEHGPPVQLL
jgi:hypothetical protein